MPRNSLALYTVMILLSSQPAFAAAVGEPDYAGVFAAREIATERYTQLERVTPANQVNTHFQGIAAGKSIITFPGERSPVRFKVGQPIEFVVRVTSQDQDPQGILEFVKLTSTDGYRVLPLPMASSMVPFTATKFGDSFFKVVSTQSLPPGEYSLSVENYSDGFCFGIDP